MIVVTGAAGFIGANTVAALNAAGRKDIVAADAFAPGHEPRLPSNPAYLDEMDVAARVDKADLAGWLGTEGADVEAVVHIGACSDTTATDRAFMLANNTEYTRTLWNWCTANERPFVYASSAATYGDGSQGYDDEADARIFKPLNLYGESKHRLDLWALQQAETPPRWVGLKYFNVYGPRERHKGRMASVALHAWDQIRRDGRVKLFQSHKEGISHGGQKRDFVYVEDAVRATLHFLSEPVSEDAPNGLYNVGTGHARTFEDLAKAVFAALDMEPDIEYIPMPEDLRGKYQYFTQATVAKRRRAGLTEPFASIETGVAKYVQYLMGREGQA